MARPAEPAEPAEPPELVELVIPGTGVVDREEALRSPDVRLVSGDGSAGWYRASEADGAQEPHVLREVYDWPRLMIGGAGRAVWLFLLPFLVINLVTWMQPRLARGRSWAGSLYSFGARLLGLSLTVMLVGVFGQTAMDQVVWQCGAESSGCAVENALVSTARRMDPGVGLVLAAFVPLVVGTLMAFSARDAKREYRPVLRTAQRTSYERDEERDRQAEENPHRFRGSPRRPLEVRGFWEHNTRAEGLTTRHLCAGLLTVAMLLVVPPLQYDLREGDATAAMTVFVLTLLMAVLVVIDGPYFRVRGSEERPRRRRRWPLRHARAAVGACVVVTALAMLCCAVPERDWDVERLRSGMLPGMGAEANYVVIAQGVGIGLMVLGCLAMIAARDGTASRTTLYGLLGPVVGVLACFIGWLYTAAFSVWAQGWLTPDGDPYAAAIPRAVQVIAGAFPVVVLVGAVVGGVAAAVTAVRRPWTKGTASAPGAAGAGQDPDTGRHTEHDPDDADDNRRQRRTLQFAEYAGTRGLNWYDRGLATLAVLVVLLTCAMYGAYWVGDGSLLLGVRERTVGALKQLTTLGAVILAGLLVVAVFAVRAIVLRPEMRRNAGLAWSFGAFWPRAAHPFTPAAWAVRTVPELVHRIEYLLGENDRRRMLIQAHSMGSVIAVAALWQVRPELRWRIALLTTGSPVGAVFRRHYPGYAPAASIQTLAQGRPDLCPLHAWINVHRTTDLLSGPVFEGMPEGSGSKDEAWQDGVNPMAVPTPTGPQRTPAQPVFWPLERHNGYRRAPRFQEIRTDLLTALRQAQPPPPPPASGLPASRRPGEATGPEAATRT
ncbi:hypothetical protein ACM01_12530 [Streptomyces viridochromogenes]|uniref:Integral membrane protein n=1 Tax=Streptomyces viridochromogenes TaxID=1938 RepID=A0A0J7ZH44_STRVR|nr:hypothetical protein [Streptomyces viridochromogenes]KMS74747.1 hypothetical protein ACM01_12530 [Streptomyces viridochromogenes]KOG14806.1 hypothetical protein ADK36_30075 [Streptomyces viridochromogenes]KOG15000.1 hypothetical protein ADK35_29720 [Streptomyces viridochromogenes]